MSVRFGLDIRTDDEKIEIVFTGEGPGEGADKELVTTLRDTDRGMDVRTEIRKKSGETISVITDKTDRGTPPIVLLNRAIQELLPSLMQNTQSVLNAQRYARLVREGERITQRTMCMCGQHTDEKWDEVPFESGVIGVGSAEQLNGLRGEKPRGEVTKLDKSMEDQLRTILDRLNDGGDDDGTVEV